MNKPRKDATGVISRFTKDLRNFLLQGIGDEESNNSHHFNRIQRVAQRNVRILVLAARWDVLKQLKLHAQALTYDTLLALVPLLAVIFSIFKGLGGFEKVQAQITSIVIDNLTGTSELRTQVATYLEQFVGNVHAGKLGILSIIILVWSVLSLLGHIEFAFNQIYGTSSSRPWLMRLLTYWSLLTFGPILLAASFALTAALQSSWLTGILNDLNALGSLSVYMTPFLVTWLALTIMYVAVPNTRVHLGSAASAAFIAGLLWTLAKQGYAFYVSTNLTLHNIYGSVSAIPLFILWLYVSWLLVLFGAQLAFAFQNSRTYQYEEPGRTDSQRHIDFAACALMLEISCEHLNDNPPPLPGAIAEKWGIPRRLLETVLNKLRDGHFVHDVTNNGGLTPAKNLAHVSPRTILNYLRAGIGSQAQFYPRPEAGYLNEILDSLELRSPSSNNEELSFRQIVEKLDKKST